MAKFHVELYVDFSEGYDVDEDWTIDDVLEDARLSYKNFYESEIRLDVDIKNLDTDEKKHKSFIGYQI